MENIDSRKISRFSASVLPAAALFFLSAGPSLPASGSGNKGPAWTAKDSSEAASFIRAFKQHPERIDSLAAGPGNFSQEKDLGFGYRLKEVWVNPAGKLGFTLKIVAGRQGPVSFEAKPVMNYAALADRCHAVLKAAFTKAGPDHAAVTRTAPGMPAYLPYHWNLQAAEALPADSLGLPDEPPPPGVRQALAYYMTPYSGTTYGIRGGRGGQMLENRDRFLSLGDSLMLDKTRALYLLRSLNPASRLTAAEFVIRHKAAFPTYEQLLDGALKKVFANPARAETMRGDAVLKEDARKLAFEYAAAEVKRTGRGVFRQ